MPEFFGEELEVGLPGFLFVAVGDLLSGFTESFFQFGNCLSEARGDLGEWRSEGELFGCPKELADLECYRIFVKFGEGFFGDLWGHEGMAITVAAWTPDSG